MSKSYDTHEVGELVAVVAALVYICFVIWTQTCAA